MFRNLVDGKLSYRDFVWFLISEEDKRHPRRLASCSIYGELVWKIGWVAFVTCKTGQAHLCTIMGLLYGSQSPQPVHHFGWLVVILIVIWCMVT